MLFGLIKAITRRTLHCGLRKSGKCIMPWRYRALSRALVVQRSPLEAYRRAYSTESKIEWIDFKDMPVGKAPPVRSNDIIEEFGLDIHKLPRTAIQTPVDSQKDARRKYLESVVRSGSSMLAYIASLQLKYEDSIVLTQVGSFYELYFDQAAEVSRDLNLKVARRNENNKAENSGMRYNMAGFPCYQLDRYLKILVNDMRRHVVIAEQIPDLNAQNSQLLADEFKRPVTRKISPGTLIGDSFADTSRSNFLLSIVFSRAHVTEQSTAPENSPVGLAWLDLSVGSCFYQRSTIENLASDLTRIAPREILMDSWLEKHHLENGDWHPGLSELQNEDYLITYCKFPPAESFGNYRHMFTEPSAAMFDKQFDIDSKILTGMCSILEYVRDNLPESKISLQTPREETSGEIMQIDSRSMRALDILACGDSQSLSGSLLSILNRSVTAVGSRLLTSWLSAPLLSVDKIRSRQQMVKFFVDNPVLATTMLTILRGTSDCEKILQRLSLRSFDPMELVDVASSIKSIHELYSIIPARKNVPKLAEWRAKLKIGRKTRDNLASRILNSIDMDALRSRQVQQGEAAQEGETAEFVKPEKDLNGLGNYPIVKETASERLKALYDEDRQFDTKRRELEERFIQLQDNPNIVISLKWSLQRLYHVHLRPKGKRSVGEIKIPGVIIAQSKGAIAIQNEEWSLLGTLREKFKASVLLEEKRILDSLRKDVLALSTNLRDCAQVIGEMDVLISFAQLARSERLVCPEITEDPILDIRKGRHLTVESGLERRGENFVSNDCEMGYKKPSIWMITGPNMGGKSTFIRQVAIMAIIAHIGCFVPASYAKVGIVDRLFCRVGAGDDLYRGRSTFMVEMLETSNILRKSTPRSLAILDEVGRGTSGRDGLAIAYATVWHLIRENKCRALFATHFGKELAELLHHNGIFDYVGCYKSTIKDVSGRSIVFNYRLEPGICEDSQGVSIASFSGFPLKSIHQAQLALQQMDSAQSPTTSKEDRSSYKSISRKLPFEYLGRSNISME